MDPLSRSRPSAGPEAAVEATLLELAPLVRSWVFRYVGPCSDLDDFIQEAMIELVRALDGFRGESSIKTYARRVVMRSVTHQVRRHRHRSRTVVSVAEPQATAAGDPERSAASQQDVLRLYDALLELSEARRNAVVLCDLEGLGHQEAADIEGVKIDAFRARLRLGRAELRAKLGLHEVAS